MVFLVYPNEVIVFLLEKNLAMLYLSKIQKIWYGAQTIQGYLGQGIAHSLSILFYEHEHNMHYMHLNWIGAPYCFNYSLGLQHPHHGKQFLSKTCNTLI
jgi:hypothetical protein